MMLRLIFLLIGFIFLNSHDSFAQFEEEEDSLIVLPEKQPLKFKPSVYLRTGAFQGFGNPVVFNQVPFTKGLGLSFDRNRFSFGLDMDFFSFKNKVFNNIRKDRVYHIKGFIQFNLLDHPKHDLYLGGAFGRLETLVARYQEGEVDLETALLNKQRYWVASPQLSYYYIIPFQPEQKWALKLGGFLSYAVPLQGYYAPYEMEKLPNKDSWYLDGALHFGVSVGICQLK